MKKNLMLILFLSIGIGKSLAQVQEKNDPFLFIIFELTENEDALLEANIISSQLIEKRLKTPTKSEDVSYSKNYVCVQILSDDGGILDCVNYHNPLDENLEYVNHEGQLDHTHFKRDNNAFVLRRNAIDGSSQIKILHYENDEIKLLKTSNLY